MVFNIFTEILTKHQIQLHTFLILIKNINISNIYEFFKDIKQLHMHVFLISIQKFWQNIHLLTFIQKFYQNTKYNLSPGHRSSDTF